MNKTDLVNKVSKKSKLTKKDTRAAIDAMTGLITEALRKGDNVCLTGFGKFEVRNRKKRIATNPRSGEKLTIPATRVPCFKSGRTLRTKILA